MNGKRYRRDYSNGFPTFVFVNMSDFDMALLTILDIGRHLEPKLSAMTPEVEITFERKAHRHILNCLVAARFSVDWVQFTPQLTG